MIGILVHNKAVEAMTEWARIVLLETGVELFVYDGGDIEDIEVLPHNWIDDIVYEIEQRAHAIHDMLTHRWTETIPDKFTAEQDLDEGQVTYLRIIDD